MFAASVRRWIQRYPNTIRYKEEEEEEINFSKLYENMLQVFNMSTSVEKRSTEMDTSCVLF